MILCSRWDVNLIHSSTSAQRAGSVVIAIVRNRHFILLFFYLFYFILLCFCSEGRDMSIKAHKAYEVSHPSPSLTWVCIWMIKNYVCNSSVMVVLVSNWLPILAVACICLVLQRCTEISILWWVKEGEGWDASLAFCALTLVSLPFTCQHIFYTSMCFTANQSLTNTYKSNRCVVDGWRGADERNGIILRSCSLTQLSRTAIHLVSCLYAFVVLYIYYCSVQNRTQYFAVQAILLKWWRFCWSNKASQCPFLLFVN